MRKKPLYDKLVDWFDVKIWLCQDSASAHSRFYAEPHLLAWLNFSGDFWLTGTNRNIHAALLCAHACQAFSSTMFVINSVPLGQLIETLHLYTAYAMIILTFLHLVRNYFGSAHKGNRDLMWLAGIVLAVIVISFGVTGYLLPWTVVSKSASDVAIGFINFLPVGLANIGKFVVVGSGSDASQLTTFLHVHTVFLPLAIIAFLGLKIYMYEVHGPAYVPAYGKPGSGKLHKWFPKIFLYAVMLMSAYVAILLAAASLFPLVLPPAYSCSNRGHDRCSARLVFVMGLSASENSSF